MPTWGELLKELNTLIKSGEKAPHDVIRRKYLLKLNQYTGRDTIVYASGWTNGKDSRLVGINEEDRKGFMEAVASLKSDQLD